MSLLTRCLLVLVCLLGGCSADVQHALARLEGDAVAYRLRVRPHEPVSSSVRALVADLGVAPAGAVVRTWQDTDGAFVLQARFDDVSTYTGWVSGVWSELSGSVRLPAGLRPPDIEIDGVSWRIDAAATPVGEGAWSLLLDGPSLVGEPTRRLAGRGMWQAPVEGDRVQAEIRSEPPPSFADFLIQGGPALACALAGLALLMWVNRRTRRRVVQRAR